MKVSLRPPPRAGEGCPSSFGRVSVCPERSDVGRGLPGPAPPMPPFRVSYREDGVVHHARPGGGDLPRRPGGRDDDATVTGEEGDRGGPAPTARLPGPLHAPLPGLKEEALEAIREEALKAFEAGERELA